MTFGQESFIYYGPLGYEG